MHYLQWFVKSPNLIQWKNYKRNTCFHTVEKCLKIHFALRSWHIFLMTLFWSAYQMSFTNKQKIRRYQYLLWYELYPGVPVLISLYHEIGKCSKIHMGDPLCPELQWKHRHSKLVHFAFQIWSLSIYLLILHSSIACLFRTQWRSINNGNISDRSWGGHIKNISYIDKVFCESYGEFQRQSTPPTQK